MQRKHVTMDLIVLSLQNHIMSHPKQCNYIHQNQVKISRPCYSYASMFREHLLESFTIGKYNAIERGALTLVTPANGRGGDQSWRRAPTRPRRDPHLQNGGSQLALSHSQRKYGEIQGRRCLGQP